VALILPVLLFLLLIPVIRRGQSDAARKAGGWELAALLSAALCGAAVTLSLEALTLFQAIRAETVTLVWLLLDVAAAAWLLAHLRWNPLQRQTVRLHLAWDEWLFVSLLALLLGGLLAVAWVAPANTPDSLLYHMARVVHWAQDASLRHYGTAYGHQLWNPPFAETVVLTVRTLWGSDRPANLVQWSALVGSLIAVSGIGRLLGLGRRGRFLAVAVAASIPMAVLQATSTQNDLVTAFWLAAAAAFVLLSRSVRPGWLETLGLGLSLGLGLLTKGTFYVFGLPVAVWFVVTRPWRSDARRILLQLALIGASVLVLNLGYWSRNLAAADTPLGPSDWVGGHGTTTLASLKPKVALYPLRLLRGLAPHLAGPWPAWTEALDSGVKTAFAAFDVDVNAPIAVWAWNHEDLAGNPLHLLLIGATIAGLAWRRRRDVLLELAACVTAAFLLMGLFVSPALTIFGVRLQLPLFVLWAPVAAGVFAPWLPARVRSLAAGAMILSAAPWLLFNGTRPAIGLQERPGRLSLPCSPWWGCTRVASVFVASPVELAFAAVPTVQDDLVQATRALEGTECRSVGLRIDSSDPEYLVWYLLNAPQSGFRLQTIYTTSDLEPMLDRDFKPCAILCTVCGERARLNGLDLVYASGRLRLYAGDSFTWDPDG